VDAFWERSIYYFLSKECTSRRITVLLRRFEVERRDPVQYDSDPRMSIVEYCAETLNAQEIEVRRMLAD
jgi:hypothetical protein